MEAIRQAVEHNPLNKFIPFVCCSFLLSFCGGTLKLGTFCRPEPRVTDASACPSNKTTAHLRTPALALPLIAHQRNHVHFAVDQ
jgi:hypothetical protein